MLFTSHEHVVGVAPFSQCVLLIELNARDNERFSSRKIIQNKESKEDN